MILAELAVEEQLELRCSNACRRFSSKSGNAIGSGVCEPEVAQVQPLAGEVVDERVGARDRRASAAPAARGPPAACSCPVAASVEQFVVGNAAPEEERQARRQLEIADPVYAAFGATLAGSRSMRNRKSGLTSMRAQRRLDAAVERRRLPRPSDRSPSAAASVARRSPDGGRRAARASTRICRAHACFDCSARPRRTADENALRGSASRPAR